MPVSYYQVLLVYWLLQCKIINFLFNKTSFLWKVADLIWFFSKSISLCAFYDYSILLVLLVVHYLIDHFFLLIDEVDSVILLLYVEGLVDCCNQFKSEWNTKNYNQGYVLVGSSSFNCLFCCCMVWIKFTIVLLFNIWIIWLFSSWMLSNCFWSDSSSLQ